MKKRYVPKDLEKTTSEIGNICGFITPAGFRGFLQYLSTGNYAAINVEHPTHNTTGWGSIREWVNDNRNSTVYFFDTLTGPLGLYEWLSTGHPWPSQNGT